MMNEDIKVESELGKGSKFTITIFLKLQNRELAPIEELIHLPVLVVDDDRDCCETTVALLEKIGIDGEWVTSGQEAVKRAAARYEQNDHYFAIIIDWKMPGMDGIETTRQIRKLVGKDVTIIILSAYDYTEIEQEASDEWVSGSGSYSQSSHAGSQEDPDCCHDSQCFCRRRYVVKECWDERTYIKATGYESIE